VPKPELRAAPFTNPFFSITLPPRFLLCCALRSSFVAALTPVRSSFPVFRPDTPYSKYSHLPPRQFLPCFSFEPVRSDLGFLPQATPSEKSLSVFPSPSVYFPNRDFFLPPVLPQGRCCTHKAFAFSAMVCNRARLWCTLRLPRIPLQRRISFCFFASYAEGRLLCVKEFFWDPFFAFLSFRCCQTLRIFFLGRLSFPPPRGSSRRSPEAVLPLLPFSRVQSPTAFFFP